MSEHDPHLGTAPGSARPHSVPPGLAAPTGPRLGGAGGFEPISLRTAVDVPSAEARLAALGQSRSTSALGERADLLRLLGRLDEALAIAEEAFRLAHFTGDRADSTAARIRRAHIFREQGKLDRALNDLHTSRITAATEEWRGLEAAAAELEGYTLLELERHDEARENLAQALTAYAATGAPRDRVTDLQNAFDDVLRAYLAPDDAPAAPDDSSAGGAAHVADAPLDAPRPGDTNPTAGLPSATQLEPAAVDPAAAARAAATRTDDSDDDRATRRDDRAAARSAAQSDRPVRADTSLWGKISSLAANAAGHREGDRFRDSSPRADHAASHRSDDDDDDTTRPGATGVTGVVEGLPKDDQPTTWPFPSR
jgi:tetratricopeptide (TPR) repeat protein